MVLNYQVAYQKPTNFLANVKSVIFTRNLHPVEDTFEVHISNTNTFPSTSFSTISVGTEILIYRNDGINPAPPDTSSLRFRGVVTNVDYKMGDQGLDATVTGRGLWYLLQTRILSVGGWTPQPYPNTNPYIVSLNTLLNRSFNMIYSIIMQLGYGGASSPATISTIVQAPTDFDGTVTTVTQPTSVKDTIIHVATTGTFAPGNAIYIGNLVDFTNPTPPSNITGEVVTITGVSTSNLTLSCFSSPLTVTHTSGSALYNYIVNDQMLLQYVSIDAALQRLVQSAVPNNMGEFFLDITKTVPTLSVKLYSPLASPPVYGIGLDKSVTNSSNPQILFVEGDNIKTFDFSQDYEGMANSIIYTGQQFAGSEIFALAIENVSSINTYGLKQTTQSVGNVIDQLEIKSYISNLLPLIQNPIPSLSINVVNSYPNSFPINPGDIISITSPTFSNIAGTGANATFSVRVQKLAINWSVAGGEDTTITLMVPLIQAGQYVSRFAGQSLNSAFGNLNSNTDNATRLNTGGMIEDLGISWVTNVKDRVSNSGTVFPSQAPHILNIANQIMKQVSANTQVIATIYRLTLNITTDRADLSNVILTIAQPDGMIIYKQSVTLGSTLNLLNIIQPQYDDSSGVLLSLLSGNYVIGLSNNFSPDDVTYTCTLTCAYVRDPSAVGTTGAGPSGAPFDFSMSANPSALTTSVGMEGDLTTTINVQLVNGGTAPVTLTTQNLPAGLTASYSPNPVNPSGSSTMTLHFASFVDQGSYFILVIGNGGGVEHTTPFTLQINGYP